MALRRANAVAWAKNGVWYGRVPDENGRLRARPVGDVEAMSHEEANAIIRRKRQLDTVRAALACVSDADLLAEAQRRGLVSVAVAAKRGA